MESITSSGLPNSTAAVYEVSLLKASRYVKLLMAKHCQMTIKFICYSLEATILITVLEQPMMDDPLSPSTPALSLMMRSFRIREGLWSALLSYQTHVITISRFGNNNIIIVIFM